MAEIPIDIDPIVITASRTPVAEQQSAASVTVIDQQRIERMGEPQLSSYLRLVPSAAVSTSGPMGSLTEVRIRGAEANHTLLFIDGIRANDPAESNAPRFELLNADLLSRVEVVRGPQSALWGSEAIGGVVAVSSAALSGFVAMAEAGSHGFVRASGSAGHDGESLDASLGAGVQRAHGINNLASVEGGERDGFHNLALRGRVSWRALNRLQVGLSGFSLHGRSEFDGYDPVSFARADTLDETRNRLSAVRLGGDYGGGGPFTVRAWASRLWSSNRNYLDDSQINQTQARRDTAGAQVEGGFSTGALEHSLIAVAEVDHETFEARGFTEQDRRRRHIGLTGEWRTQVSGRLSTDFAVRHDDFNRFADATSLRASALFRLAEPLALGASYSEGIAQPNFTELYGFFPGGFVGNPDLKPERSRGIEVTAKLRRGRLSADLTLFRQRLRDEIVTLYSPLNTTVNAQGKSKRGGLEAEVGWRHSEALNLTATYARLDAKQPGGTEGDARELRRPKHSGSVSLDGIAGAWAYGGSLAYTGAHLDQRDEAPYELVRLGSYWLASARVAYQLRPGLELFARATNGFDAQYQGVAGYRTEGRSLYAGVRLARSR